VKYSSFDDAVELVRSFGKGLLALLEAEESVKFLLVPLFRLGQVITKVTQIPIRKALLFALSTPQVNIIKKIRWIVSNILSEGPIVSIHESRTVETIERQRVDILTTVQLSGPYTKLWPIKTKSMR